MRFMSRVFFSITASLAMGASALACDLQTATKQPNVVGYVKGAQQCLTTPPDGFSFDEAFELDNISRVNEERTKRGLDPLVIRHELRDAARWHSFDMAANNYFNHNEKSGRTHGERIVALDRTLIFNIASENIAMARGVHINHSDREFLHTGLMESPSHKAAILSPDVSHIAVGAARFENGVWLTQLFVNKMGEFSEPVPLFVRPDQDIEFDAYITEWQHTGFDARQNGKLVKLETVEETGNLRLPEEVRGDFQLMVRGEKNDGEVRVVGNRREQSFRRIALSGPLMSTSAVMPASLGPVEKPLPEPKVNRITRTTRTIKNQ